jgi:SAM-dependent methyltransferase
MRRTYYDHEDAYQRIHASGGRGWDDLNGAASGDSYVALEEFLRSPMCRFKEGAAAIDLGCGGGQSSLLLAQRRFAVTGVDFSPTAIELARENARHAPAIADFRVANCLDLREFASGCFDLAVDNHTLHCLIGADRSQFLEEARRLLRPGGLLFSETMSAEGAPDFVALGVDPVRRVDAHATRYWTTLAELVRALSSAGFVVLTAQSRPQPDVPNPGDTLVTVSGAI